MANLRRFATNESEDTSDVFHPPTDLCIGRPMVFFILQSHRQPPCGRLYPGQLDSARPGIGGPVAFQSPKNEKDIEEKLLQCQRKDTAVNERAAELCSKRCHHRARSHRRDDAVRKLPRTHCKSTVFLVSWCGVILQGLSAEKTNMLKGT